MPGELRDALRLLDVTLKARENYPDAALCTMSIGGMGCLSHVAGLLYGSDMSFAVGGKVSASGQIPIEEARRLAGTLLKYA
jgi:3-dehydroquinate dehydratase-1